MGEVILKVRCDEPEGRFDREVRFLPLSAEALVDLWEKLSQFPILFNRQYANFDDFVTTFISQNGDGEVKANGLVWTVDDVGIIFMTDIYPGYQATGHFTFWDKRFRGRENLIRMMLKYVFDEFEFRRFIAEIPLYSRPTLRAVERVGFVKEGRMRKAAWFDGAWWDVNLYSVLREETEAWDF